MQQNTLSQKQSSLALIAIAALLAALFFFIPMEHKYDKLFRFYSLTLIPEGLELPHHFDKKIYFYLTDLAGAALFGFGLFRLRRRFFNPEGIFLAAIFFFAFLSIALSPMANYPIPYTRLFQLFTPFALFFFLSSGLIPKEKLFPIFSWSLFASGTLQGGIAACQYLSQKALGLRFFGEQPLGPTIRCPGGRLWLFDAFSKPGEIFEPIFRAMGTMPHPNVLGGILVVSLLLTTHQFTVRRSFRLFLAPCYLLQLFALATTYSRSAIFAYLLSTLFWLLWMRKKSGCRMTHTVTLIIASSALIATLFGEQYLHRGGIVNYTSTARASDSERLYYQNIAIRMAAAHPLTGVGYGQFSIHAPSFGADPKNISATHNIYLILAAETGLFSLAAFLGWIGMLFFRAIKSTSNESGILLSIFCAFLFIGLCDFYPIAFHQGALLFFGAAGTLAATILSQQESTEDLSSNIPLSTSAPFHKELE